MGDPVKHVSEDIKPYAAGDGNCLDFSQQVFDAFGVEPHIMFSSCWVATSRHSTLAHPVPDCWKSDFAEVFFSNEYFGI